MKVFGGHFLEMYVNRGFLGLPSPLRSVRQLKNHYVTIIIISSSQKDILHHDLLFYIINDGGIHWTLMVEVTPQHTTVAIQMSLESIHNPLHVIVDSLPVIYLNAP